MNPLRLPSAEWRALRYLATYSVTATRVGFRATQLREHTGADRADLVALADLRYITGRLHKTQQAYPICMQTADNPLLRIHLTKAGKAAADRLDAPYRALCHLRAHGSLPLATLQHDASVGPDTLTELEALGYIETAPTGHQITITSAGRRYAHPHDKDRR
ncbi:hypothetical protein [Nonomuraea diastatica]|uniref:RHD domain-containing protein n=1 Tax=Nonomuraea diastatica TaxID=1848329 RepID=A0A4R4VA81_9ACTN|nr:hypothetical protein [Nonomuraea diastatica]TDD02002.1 hypothetical protein E1294_51430 [Nonomuraea diastatica]